MKTKSINIPADSINEKIEFICQLIHINSKKEMSVVKSLYKIGGGNPTPIPPETRSLECLTNKINPNTFDVCLSRLIKKGVIQRAGQIYMLHDAFKNLEECGSVLVNFKPNLTT
jgi:hypothetical protein